VAFSLLLSKLELSGRDERVSPMQHCVWLGLFMCVAQFLALALGWNGMNAASLSMLQVSVAAYIVIPNWVLGVMLKPLHALSAFSSKTSGIKSWDATRRFAIRVALVLHIFVMVPVIWVATTILVQRAGWQGMHTIEWLHCLWMSFAIFELIVLLRLVRSVSRALIGAIKQHVVGTSGSEKNEALHALAFRVKIFEYGLCIMIAGIVLLMTVPVAFKATYGFFPHTTVSSRLPTPLFQSSTASPPFSCALRLTARERARSRPARLRELFRRSIRRSGPTRAGRAIKSEQECARRASQEPRATRASASRSEQGERARSRGRHENDTRSTQESELTTYTRAEGRASKREQK
jgi:hypothetical protein